MEKAANRHLFVALFSEDLWVYRDKDMSEKRWDYEYAYRRVGEDQQGYR